MDIIRVRKFEKKDVKAMVDIWNSVVSDGIAFPQTDLLGEKTGEEFFASQTAACVAENVTSAEILGLYILHPNNVGRCGHISNASYAVKKGERGKHIGEKLVTHCLEEAKRSGFGILQFNAVVKTNIPARRLYEKLGFVPLGVIPGGFLKKDGKYEDIVPYYHTL